MELTGKCKEDFEKWLIISGTYGEEEYHDNEDLLSHFENLKPSMQYGVYVDFFQGTGKKAQVYIAPFFNYDLGTMYEWGAWADGQFVISCEAPKEARTAAIEKANEIYNNNHE
jgi:hypothetical protein